MSLLSFDPHPLLSPHPYFEWFSLDQQHYRIELEPNDAWVMKDSEWDSIIGLSQRIHEALVPPLRAFSLLTVSKIFGRTEALRPSFPFSLTPFFGAS